MRTRIEHDSMGEVEVPADALWRAQTQRAVENFPISGMTIEPALIVAMARVKRAAAITNASLGVIDQSQADAILQHGWRLIDIQMQSAPQGDPHGGTFRRRGLFILCHSRLPFDQRCRHRKACDRCNG